MMLKSTFKIMTDVVENIDESLREGNKENLDYSLKFLKKILKWESEDLFDDIKYDTKTIILKIKNPEEED